MLMFTMNFAAHGNLKQAPALVGMGMSAGAAASTVTALTVASSVMGGVAALKGAFGGTKAPGAPGAPGVIAKPKVMPKIDDKARQRKTERDIARRYTSGRMSTALSEGSGLG